MSQVFYFNKGFWNKEEHKRFVEALFLNGPKWNNAQTHIKTRSVQQCKSHYKKFFKSFSKKFNIEFESFEMESHAIISYMKREIIPLILDYAIVDGWVFKLDRLFKIFQKYSNPKYKKFALKKCVSCSCIRRGGKCDCLNCCDVTSLNGLKFPIFKIEKFSKAIVPYPQPAKQNKISKIDFNIPNDNVNFTIDNLFGLDTLFNSSHKSVNFDTIPFGINEKFDYYD